MPRILGSAINVLMALINAPSLSFCYEASGPVPPRLTLDKHKKYAISFYGKLILDAVPFTFEKRTSANIADPR